MSEVAPHATLYVRDYTPAGMYERQRAVLERLQRLRGNRRIADVTVASWGSRIPMPDDADSTDVDGAQSVRDTYRAIDDWAAEHGYSLAPAFDTLEVGSLVSGDKQGVVVLPAICLVLSDGEAIRDVYPCSTDDGLRTVEDGLEALESRAVRDTLIVG